MLGKKESYQNSFNMKMRIQNIPKKDFCVQVYKKFSYNLLASAHSSRIAGMVTRSANKSPCNSQKATNLLPPKKQITGDMTLYSLMTFNVLYTGHGN